MQEWLKISLLLCTFGFLKEIRPSESFIMPYLTDDRWRNVTMEELLQEAFPIGTYSYLSQLVIIFLITDALRYKPLIILSGISGIIVWSMLIWTTSLQSIQILEGFYGTYMATEVAYYTYIYAKVDRQHYQKVTSHTRAAILCGRFLAATTGQILILFELMNYRQLNYLSLTSQILATIWAFTLPNVDTSMYFHRKPLISSDQENGHDDKNKLKGMVKIKSAFLLIWDHFKASYTNLQVIQWSIWYALGMCGYLQIISYIQALWEYIDDNPKYGIWNGAVEASLTLLGAIVSLLAGYLHSGFLKPMTSLAALMVVSLLEGSALFLATFTENLYVCYLGYMLFCILYSFAITVSAAEVAKNITDDSFGLVFGFNTLIALCMQTILTVAVVDQRGFALNPRGQYTVYSCYFIVIGLIYLVFLILEYATNWFGISEINANARQQSSRRSSKSSGESTVGTS